MKIQLKINGEWAVLPPNFSLKIMKTSPLFSDQGDFSYPFELPVEINRHIFGPIADPMGFVRLREFHALPAEIWFEGNQVFVGQTEISGEQTFSQRGKVRFNVVSNNGAFKDMIKDMSCRDVKIKDDIKLGWRPAVIKWKEYSDTFSKNGLFLKPGYTLDDVNNNDEPLHVQLTKYFDSTRTIKFNADSELEICLPEMLHVTFEPNVTSPYPFPYCTVRMCCAQSQDKAKEGESTSGGYGYKLYEADGPNRAPSFYVLYFLDCLFGEDTLDVVYDNTSVLSIDDLKRLAFLNAYPQFVDKKTNNTILTNSFLEQIDNSDSYFYNLSSSLSMYIEYSMYFTEYLGGGSGIGNIHITFHEKKFKYPDKNKEFDWKLDATVESYDCYANGDNFPDAKLPDVISDLTNGFGIIFDYDQQNNFMKLHLVRDIMKNKDVDTPSCTILTNPTITRSSKNGQILSYGESDDLNYNYAMPKGKYRDGSDDPIIINGFLNLSSIERNRTDAHTYYDESTGYAYRLRVDENTGNEPQFFPVGANRDYKIGICKENKYRNRLVLDEKDNEYDTSDTRVYADRDESDADTTELKFRPVIVNDVWSWYYNEGPGYEGYPMKKKQPGVDIYDYPESAADQMLCTYVDCEAFNDSITVDTYSVIKNPGNIAVSAKPTGTYTTLGSRAEMLKIEKATLSSDDSKTPIRIVATGIVTVAGESTFDITNERHPLADAKVGYQLGFMRGPGNKSNVEIGYNYDDEGNDTWYNVVNSPTFTADSIDPYGNVFDYNGAEAGIGTDWATKHVTADEAFDYLKSTFTKTNVPLDEERAKSSRLLIHTASYLGQAKINISFIVSTKDKDGNEISMNDAITYIVNLARKTGSNMTALYKADKSDKRIIIYGDSINANTYNSSYTSLMNVYSSGEAGNALVKVNPMEERLSLLLDARKVKEYDNDGNPVYFDVIDNNIARRGLVPQLLEDFLYFKAHHVKVTFPVLMSLSAINNLQLLKWNRFGDYVGLIKQVNYELTESGLKDVTVELLVANK